jgi:lysozyme family protein
MSIEAIIDDIIRREGGLVDHPNDKGGITKFGITLPTLRQTRAGATADDIRRLAIQDAREIYRRLYVIEPRFHDIRHILLQEFTIDCGVHHGVHRATLWLQTAADVKADGVIGNITLGAVNSKRARDILKDMIATRYEFVASIVRRDRTQADFILGWIRRINEFTKRL